jgi:hypothetical protein
LEEEYDSDSQSNVDYKIKKKKKIVYKLDFVRKEFEYRSPLE